MNRRKRGLCVLAHFQVPLDEYVTVRAEGTFERRAVVGPASDHGLLCDNCRDVLRCPLERGALWVIIWKRVIVGKRDKSPGQLEFFVAVGVEEHSQRLDALEQVLPCLLLGQERGHDYSWILGCRRLPERSVRPEDSVGDGKALLCSVLCFFDPCPERYTEAASRSCNCIPRFGRARDAHCDERLARLLDLLDRETRLRNAKRRLLERGDLDEQIVCAPVIV